MKKLKSGSLADRVSRVLFHSHITPNSTTGLSPAELLQNRRLRSRLDLLKPNISSRVIDKQAKQQLYANTHSRDRIFVEGEAVYIVNFGSGPKWMPGRISTFVGNVSVKVTLSDGRTVTRHLDHIWKKFNDDFIPPSRPDSVHPEPQVERPRFRNETSVVPTIESTVDSPHDTSVESPETSVESPETSAKSSEISVDSRKSPIEGDKSVITPSASRYPSRRRKPPLRYSPTS